MIKNIDKKHLLIVGKSKIERRKVVNDIIETANKVVYRFPANIKSFYEYFDQVRKIFPFVPANWPEQNPKKWTSNQVWDFHLDWTNNSHSILIVIEEFSNMDEAWKIQIILSYITKSYYEEKKGSSKLNIQLIVTQESDDNIIDRLSENIGLPEDEKRTERQVILGKLKIVDLDVSP